MVEKVVNPLREWLRARPHIRHNDFARKVGRTEISVTRWCTGSRHPRPQDQEKIYVATEKAVRPEDWHAYFVARQVAA